MTAGTRPRRTRRSLVVGAILLIMYICFAAAVVLWPQRVDGDTLWVYRVLYDGYANGLPMWITYQVVQVAANLVFAVPVGFFFAMVLPRSKWWAAALACALFFAVGEVIQFALPSRMPSLWDWLANSLGGLIGAVLWRSFSGGGEARVGDHAVNMPDTPT